MMVAVPRFGESVAPCFEYSATITILTIKRRRITDRVDFCLQSREPLDRVRLLRDQGVDTLICGGIVEHIEDMLRAHGIEVISWVSGNVDDLVHSYLRGGLVAGTGRLSAAASTTTPTSQKEP